MFRKLAGVVVALALVFVTSGPIASQAAGFGLAEVPKLPAAIGVGEKVTATPVAAPKGVKTTYKWFLAGVAIPKASSATLQVPQTAMGKSLLVQQFATIGKSTVLKGSSAPVTVGLQQVPSVPVVSFAASGSSTLTVTLPSDNVPGAAKPSYQWFHGGIEIPAASSATYEFKPEERGLLISVGVTYRLAGYKDKTVYSKDLEIPNLPTAYKLLWSDEFSAASVDSSVWVPQNGDGTEYRNRGWGNNERQWYLLQNSQIDKSGILNMLATRTGASQYNCYYGKCEWLSSKLVTLNKVGFKYGRVEARIKGAPGVGSWGAFWMLGGNIDERGWPGCGEIDVTEILGRDINTTYGTLHGPLSGGGGRGDKETLPVSLADGWHTYSIDWLPDSITWYIDGVQYAKQTKVDADWVFDHEFYLILNLAMGGGFGGQIDPNLNQSTMSVDYVRYYSINDIGEVIRH